MVDAAVASVGAAMGRVDCGVVDRHGSGRWCEGRCEIMRGGGFGVACDFEICRKAVVLQSWWGTREFSSKGL
ncbi:MAG: hypothetical protein KAS74_04270 [Methanosarcinales archaeon]|nr:hypothetical protein [Methanosarcinales archaeon]